MNLHRTKRKTLDKGFVILRNISGPVRRVYSDFDACETDIPSGARISFEGEDVSRGEEKDIKLYEYLIKNRHSTPIEMIETWWTMKLPIFVARQFVRHRTCTISEQSARYTTLPCEYYVPKFFGKKGKSNKQGQEGYVCNGLQIIYKLTLHFTCLASYFFYRAALACKVAPEQARLFLHVNFYTVWTWKQDLHNLMHFLSLRADSHAQKEAQVYALAMIDLLKPYLPKSMEFFETYRKVKR